MRRFLESLWFDTKSTLFQQVIIVYSTLHLYFFIGFRGAVFTYSSATIEIIGKLEIEYIANKADQPMLIYANIHGGLEELRKKAEERNEIGPVIMVAGPKHVGKTALCKLLCNYAVRETSPVLYVDLDVSMVRK